MYCALDNTSDYYSNPAVVVVHGGGFVSGNRASMSLFSYGVAQQGSTVFNIDYRLSPPGGTSCFPDAVNDIQAAVTRVRQNGANYNASVYKFGTMGVSAGGTLGMMPGLLGETGKEYLR
jgi:pectinesterase